MVPAVFFYHLGIPSVITKFCSTCSFCISPRRMVSSLHEATVATAAYPQKYEPIWWSKLFPSTRRPLGSVVWRHCVTELSPEVHTSKSAIEAHAKHSSFHIQCFHIIVLAVLKQSHQFSYKGVTLPITQLYGCESWTLTVYLERRMQAFEKKFFRRMFGMSTTAT